MQLRAFSSRSLSRGLTQPILQSSRKRTCATLSWMMKMMLFSSTIMILRTWT
jgi:hypothetical protein